MRYKYNLNKIVFLLKIINLYILRIERDKRVKLNVIYIIFIEG